MDKNLKELLKLGEGSQVEFKKKITHPEKLAKTLAAFANSGGGTILIGVDDNKTIIGINPDEETFMLEKATRFYCRPEVFFNTNIEEVDHKTLLLVEVPESTVKPHAALGQSGEWKYYIRNADQCLLVSKPVVNALSDLPEQPGPRNYSRQEQSLIDYLKTNRHITQKEFAKLVNISFRRATRILTMLVRQGDIYEHDFNQTIHYSLGKIQFNN